MGISIFFVYCYFPFGYFDHLNIFCSRYYVNVFWIGRVFFGCVSDTVIKARPQPITDILFVFLELPHAQQM